MCLRVVFYPDIQSKKYSLSSLLGKLHGWFLLFAYVWNCPMCLLFVYVIFYLHVYSVFESSLKKSTRHFRNDCTHIFYNVRNLLTSSYTTCICVFFFCCCPVRCEKVSLVGSNSGKRLLFLATENGCLNLEFVIRHIRAIVLTRTEIIFYSNI